MQILRLATISALAIAASVGVSHADSDLFLVGLGGGGNLTSDVYIDLDASIVALQGQVSGAYDITGDIGVQGDLLANGDRADFGSYDLTKTSIDGALHIYHRDPEQFLVGTFVQLGQSHYDYSYGDTFDDTRTYGGVEGQVFLDHLTLYGQLGLMGFNGDGVDGKGWFGTAEARYFLTPDFKIAASAGIFQVDFEAGGYESTGTNVLVGLSAEYKLPDLPISLVGKLDYSTSTTDAFDGSSDVTRVLVGVKFAIGDDSLEARDRNGASLKPIEPTEFVWERPI